MINLNGYTITQLVTFLASAIEKELTPEQITLLAAMLVQLGDTLVTLTAANNHNCTDLNNKNN